MTRRGSCEDARAFRAWVRTHHPDVGGDPAKFADVLSGRRSGKAHQAGGSEIAVFRSRHGLWVVGRWWRRRLVTRVKAVKVKHHVS